MNLSAASQATVEFHGDQVTFGYTSDVFVARKLIIVAF